MSSALDSICIIKPLEMPFWNMNIILYWHHYLDNKLNNLIVSTVMGPFLCPWILYGKRCLSGQEKALAYSHSSMKFNKNRNIAETTNIHATFYRPYESEL